MGKSILVCAILFTVIIPRDADGIENNYRFLYESGNYAKAISHITPLLESDPENHFLWYYLGRSHQHLMQYDEAVRAFYNVLEIDSTYLPVYFHLGRIYTETGEFDTAIELLEQAHSFDRENTTILYFLAGVYSRDERYDEALDALNLGLQLDPDDRRFLRRYADLTFRLNKFEESAQTYRTLIELGDSSAVVFRNCGISLYFLEDNPNALRCLSTAYYLDDTDPNTVLYFGLVHRAIGNIRFAIGLLNDAVALLSKGMLSDALIHLAGAYEATRDIPDAVKKYRLVLDLNADRPEAYYYLASVFDKHYADRNVPKEYYQTFLEKAGDNYPDLVRHALQRVLILREELFFDRIDGGDVNP